MKTLGKAPPVHDRSLPYEEYEVARRAFAADREADVREIAAAAANDLAAATGRLFSVAPADPDIYPRAPHADLIVDGGGLKIELALDRYHAKGRVAISARLANDLVSHRPYSMALPSITVAEARHAAIAKEIVRRVLPAADLALAAAEANRAAVAVRDGKRDASAMALLGTGIFRPPHSPPRDNEPLTLFEAPDARELGIDFYTAKVREAEVEFDRLKMPVEDAVAVVELLRARAAGRKVAA